MKVSRGPALDIGGVILSLTRASAVVGRAASGVTPDLDLGPYDGDRSVSRRHAVVEYDGANLTLTDLGSANGTLINGRVTSGRIAIQDGDVVHFGNVKAVYRSLVRWPTPAEVEWTAATEPSVSVQVPVEAPPERTMTGYRRQRRS